MASRDAYYTMGLDQAMIVAGVGCRAGASVREVEAAIAAALDRAFTDILRDLRKQYMVGYYPANLPKDVKPFHEVRIEMARPGLQPSTRRGYYGDSAP